MNNLLKKENTGPYLRHILISALRYYLLLLYNISEKNIPYSVSKAHSQNF